MRQVLRSRLQKCIIGASTVGMFATGALIDGSASRVATASAATASSDASDVWPVTVCGTVSGHGCAPTSKRVDLVRPTFSHPTRVDNPLFPVGTNETIVQIGHVAGEPFRSETTNLHRTGVVDWYGTEVPVILVQYVAYLNGHITEVALDRYAQADDGSVWYFGESVIDYRHGGATFTEGTWLAGRDGQPAMVMPAEPQLGDVFRVENVTGIVFEELTVIRTDKNLQGPNGPVHGAIVVDELGLDGGHSKKTLAPGYGEFLTRGGGELEVVSVATPVDALPGGVPVEVREVLTAAWGTLEYARAHDWHLTRAAVRRIDEKLAVIDQSQQPTRVMTLLHHALTRLLTATRQRRAHGAQVAAVGVAQSTIDLEARYLDQATIEIARFHLLTQRLRVDAEAGAKAAVRGDVAAIEWGRERIAGALDDNELAAFDGLLAQLRSAVSVGSLMDTADIAVRLAEGLRNGAAT